jgi:hypothetical protein
MRLLLAAAAIALMVVSAHAQGAGLGGGRPQQKAGNKAPKADEKAYRDALKSIPAANSKPDPWKSMR